MKRELHLYDEPGLDNNGVGRELPVDQRNGTGCSPEGIGIAGITGDLEPGVHCKFFEDVMDVALDGVGREVKLLGNLLIGQPVCNKFDHLPLTFRHAHRFNQSRRASAVEGIFDNLRKERSGQMRWENLVAPRHRSNGFEKDVDRCILQDESRYSCLDKVQDITYSRSGSTGEPFKWYISQPAK